MNAAVKILRNTASLCPVCLSRVPAVLERYGKADPLILDAVYTGEESIPSPGCSGEMKGVYLRKTCPRHGTFRTVVWKDRMDLDRWIEREEPLPDSVESVTCSGDCFACRMPHGQGTCCVILEVTGRCDLKCAYCFARGGERTDHPSFEELCRAIDIIAKKGNGPLIQFSGGEPTLRDDLPGLIAYALKAGCEYTQVNTNGIRLAEDEEYVRRMAQAGLDIVFLQFDGTDDEVYEKLRGRALLETKLAAIENCSRNHIGVTLVPTIVRGINDKETGKIVRKAVDLFPAVKSIHFQPVTYLGRYPGRTECDRYTLDELMDDLCVQTGIPADALLPSRCDHALCEFHSTFLINAKRQMIPVSSRAFDTRISRTPAAANRAYVAEHWRRKNRQEPDSVFISPHANEMLVSRQMPDTDFDELIRLMKTSTMKISAMAFQDAMNIDLERLYRCSLHVYAGGRLLPFCRRYLTPVC